MLEDAEFLSVVNIFKWLFPDAAMDLLSGQECLVSCESFVSVNILLVKKGLVSLILLRLISQASRKLLIYIQT